VGGANLLVSDRYSPGVQLLTAEEREHGDRRRRVGTTAVLAAVSSRQQHCSVDATQHDAPYHLAPHHQVRQLLTAGLTAWQPARLPTWQPDGF
jgi:hypothetical protein